MRQSLVLVAALFLSACATMPSAISCDNADRVRAAAALALQALNRACPIPTE